MEIHTTNLFVGVIFIILLIVIITSCGTLTAAVILLITTNLYLLWFASSTNGANCAPSLNIPKLDPTPSGIHPDLSSEQVTAAMSGSDPELAPYTEFFKGPHSAYQVDMSSPTDLDSSAPYYSKFALNSSDGDIKMASMIKSMDRNERSAMGQLSKTKDFYSKYYADELDAAENKVWWERFD